MTSDFLWIRFFSKRLNVHYFLKEEEGLQSNDCDSVLIRSIFSEHFLLQALCSKDARVNRESKIFGVQNQVRETDEKQTKIHKVTGAAESQRNT